VSTGIRIIDRPVHPLSPVPEIEQWLATLKRHGAVGRDGAVAMNQAQSWVKMAWERKRRIAAIKR
jgi:hypothetical protein